MPSLMALETQGFVVVPGFLSAQELEAYCRDFETQPLAKNSNYRVRHASPDANARFTTRVADVLQAVVAQTALRPDAPQGATYFATDRGTGINFPWHQDHESFFEVQNHFDYLNFYVPIVKPRREKSNLSVVPFDVLERTAPALHRRLVRGGAARFGQLGRLRLVVCDESGLIHRVPCDLDAIAATPHLSAGDLLLMRGDVIHRTQDVETRRVALSFRVSRTGTPIRRRTLVGGGFQKAAMMAKNAEAYERMLRAFDAAGRPELPFEELRARAADVEVSAGRGRRRFFLYLMGQKLKTGTLGRFAWSAAGIYALNLAGRAYGRYHRARARWRAVA